MEDRGFLAIVLEIVKLSHYLAGGLKRTMFLTNHEPPKYLYFKRGLNK